jgi:hypothetical protein
MGARRAIWTNLKPEFAERGKIRRSCSELGPGCHRVHVKMPGSVDPMNVNAATGFRVESELATCPPARIVPHSDKS